MVIVNADASKHNINNNNDNVDNDNNTTDNSNNNDIKLWISTPARGATLYFDKKRVYKTTVCNILVLYILMKIYIKRQYGTYGFAYLDENVYSSTVWNIVVLHMLMKTYKTTIWNMTILHILMNMYIKRQYGI